MELSKIQEYVKKHYENCMKNFDLNMNFFNKLNYDEFKCYIQLIKDLSRF